MPLPQDAAGLLMELLEQAFEPLQLRLDAITILPPRPSGANPLPAETLAVVGPNATPISIAFSGWGGSLERIDMRMATGIDPALPPDKAASLAMEGLAHRLDRQRELFDLAAAVGVHAPLEGDGLLSTSHLSVDRDAVSTLVAHLGTTALARSWLERQMRLHVEDRKPFGASGDEHAVIRIVKAHLHIPFTLSPLRPARGGGEAHPEAPVWEDDTIYVSGTIPETAAALLPGRTLDELISGTPIGHRRISDVSLPNPWPLDGGDTVVILETQRERVDAMLPPEART